MSTKLYNGYRLAAGVDVLEFIARLRAVLTPVYHEKLNRAAAGLACRLVDVADLSGQDRPDCPIVEAYKTLRTEYEERGRFQFKACFGRDPNSGRTHVIMFDHGSDTYHDTWESLDGVEPYPYWNNTDRPDELSAGEWEERRDSWDRVMSGTGVPAKLLTFTLVINYLDLPGLFGRGADPLPVLGAAMPGTGERAREAARQLSYRQNWGSTLEEVFDAADAIKAWADEHAPDFERRLAPLGVVDLLGVRA